MEKKKVYVLYLILWNIDFPWKKIWQITPKNETLIYNGENYGTIPKQLMFLNKELLWKTMAIWEKTMVLWKKLWYYSKLQVTQYFLIGYTSTFCN